MEIAEQLVGEKAALIGGGAVRNKFWIVNVEEVEDGRPILQGRHLPGNGDSFKPVLKSWKVVPIRNELKQLEPGVYYQTGSEIRDSSELGVFSAITEAPVVLELG